VQLLTDQYFDQVLCFDDEAAFKQSLKERIFQTWRAAYTTVIQPGVGKSNQLWGFRTSVATLP
jgi:hypothetical protein